MTSPSVRPTVILVAGPSGSGKSTLGNDLGLPVLQLDEFYRDGTDPALPRDEHGRVDWDHPGSWNDDTALAAVLRLAETGEVDVPRYSFGDDRATGAYRVELGGAARFVAEGLFADRLVSACWARGVLADAIVLAPGRAATFTRRLTRDLREARKPPALLVRRGLALMRAHADVIARCEAAGMRRCTPAAARRELATPTARA